MKATWNPVKDQEDLKSFFEQGSVFSQGVHLILKHSNRCMISSMIKNRIDSNADSRISYYLIEVNTQRSLSNYLASVTGVKHESPQSFLIIDGKLVSAKSHTNVDIREISQVVDAFTEN